MTFGVKKLKVINLFCKVQYQGKKEYQASNHIDARRLLAEKMKNDKKVQMIMIIKKDELKLASYKKYTV